MDPITAVGLVGSVVGITDIVVRSLNGLRTLQTQYSTADRRVAMTRGNLQSVKGALDEIQDWAGGLTEEAKTTYASLLDKIDFAVHCCAIPLETLCESIEALKSKADGAGLTRRGKLAVMLGETELREMSVHLGNQVQALNLLLMAAFCKTQHGVVAVLQDEDTRSILRQVEDDSASYIQREIETASVMTRKSIASDHDELLESTFDFDSVILDSQAYRHAFETVIDERRRRRPKHGDTVVNRDMTAAALATSAAARTDAESHTELPVNSDSTSLRPESSGSDGTIRRALGDNDLEEESAIATPASYLSVPSMNSIKSGTGDNERRWARLLSPVPTTQIAHETLKINPGTESGQTTTPSRNRDLGFLTKIFSTISTTNERIAARARYAEIEKQHKADRRADRLARAKLAEMENQLKADRPVNRPANRPANRSEVKLLLLGTSESGKSTLLKQMKLIHEGSYTDDERDSFKEILWYNTVVNMRRILEAMEDFEVPLGGRESLELHVRTIFEQSSQIEGECLPAEVGLAIKELWADSGVLEAYRRRREYQLCSNAEYLFNNIDRIAQHDYIPNDEDVLHSRVKTTGVTETTFTIGALTYRVFDIGGTRSERKKWILCFENVTIILFLVDASAYDLLLFEDETANRMQEALTLFDSICNSRWFVRTMMVLFFNKVELFRDKLPVSPMKNYFPDYEGGASYEAATEYILNRFVSLNQHETKQIHAHFISAADTFHMRFVMAAVNDIIIQDNMRLSGLI